MTKYIILILNVLMLTYPLQAQQRRSDKFLDITAGPGLGLRVMGAYKVPKGYYATKTEFKDSLDKADRPGQTFNFGIQYMWKQNAFDAIGIGLNYLTLGFRRVRDELHIGDEIHPEVGVIAGAIQSSGLKIKYNYRYHYVEAPILWQRSAEGYGNLKEFDLWYGFGFAPAVLLRDRVQIFTEGFTLNGTNTFLVKNHEHDGFAFNMLLHGTFRAEYYMYKNIHGLVQPQLRIPLLPSAQGVQTIWLPQVSLNVGLVFLVGDK